MKKCILLFLILPITLFLSSCTTTQDEEFNFEDAMNQLVRIDRCFLLQSDMEEEFFSLTAEMTQSLKADPEWFAEFKKENKYFPYVYNERMGITEVEYNGLFLNGKYVTIIDIGVPSPFSCERNENSIYSIDLSVVDLRFAMDLEQNTVVLEDGTTLDFAGSVDLDQSENLLGNWFGSTYSYLDVRSDETNEQLYKLGIHDEVTDIGNENWMGLMQAMQDDELDCRFVSITIGKYKGPNKYIIYYRQYDTTGDVVEHYIIKLYEHSYD